MKGAGNDVIHRCTGGTRTGGYANAAHGGFKWRLEVRPVFPKAHWRFLVDQLAELLKGVQEFARLDWATTIWEF